MGREEDTSATKPPTGEGGTPEEIKMQIEQGDEGEVLLRKIAQLKKELRGYEDELVGKSRESSSTNSRVAPVRSHNVHGNNSDGTAAVPGRKVEPYTSASSGMDAYELLEEKHYLSGGTCWAPNGSNSEAANSTAEFITIASVGTENTGASTFDTRHLSPAASSSTKSSDSDDEVFTSKLGKWDSSSTLVTSKRDQNREATTNTETPAPTVIQRAQRTRAYPLPGAVSVNDGISENLSRRRVSQIDDDIIDEEIAAAQQQGFLNSDANENRNDDILVEADLVNAANTADIGPLVSAKRDPWYRRNQWWLAGALVLVIATIILSTVLTTIDLNPAQAPTLSPTTQVDGVLAETEELILSSFPAAAAALTVEGSPQEKALRWVSGRRSEIPLQLNSKIRILQHYALATLFISTFGDSSWTNTEGWLNGTDACMWYGVECGVVGDEGSAELTVIGLSLSSNSVSGSIPADVAILSPSLLKLDLSMNNISGFIPSEIGLLSLLTTMHLKMNRLGGNIPPSISSLLALESLDLSFNQLTGSIPREIDSLARLRAINMGRNDLIDGIPSELGRLTRLEYFNCESNRLGFDIPTEMGRLTRLESFHGGSNGFAGMVPSELALLRRISFLDLSDNLITGSIPYQITLLSNLTSLDLSLNLLSGTVPEEIGLLRQLTSLNLSNNDLSHLLPDSIGSLRGLLHLDVSDNDSQEDVNGAFLFGTSKQGDDVPWFELSRLTKLITLDFSGMPINFYTGELLKLTNLEVLGIAKSNLKITGGDLLLALTELTKLRELDLSNNGLSRKFFISELNALTSLEVLNLHGNEFGGSLPTELGLLKQLTIFDLEGSALSGAIPPEIFSLANLTYLNLAGDPTRSSNLLTGPLSTDIAKLAKLQRLNLGLSQITGTIPSEIAELKQLEELCIHGSAMNGTIPSEITALTRLRKFIAHDTRITGPIPDFDSRFGRLEVLDLSRTSLSGSIPSGMWSLSMLTKLLLSRSSGIHGHIPPEVQTLSRLISLDLAGVELTGSAVPSAIGLLSKLQQLDLTDASLSGTIPPELFNCAQLTNLNMGGNKFSGSLPTDIGLATNLLILQITNVPITGVIPAEIGNLQLLKTLSLSNTDISGTIISEMTSQLVLLENLDLGSTRISGSIPAAISDLLSLQSLSLTRTALTGTIPSEMALMVELGWFDISFASISGTLPAEMATLTNLSRMDLRGTEITGSIADERCGYHGSEFSGAIQITYRTVYIDCGEVECTCCECFPTGAPSLSSRPSFSPPTLHPSVSIPPTALPSKSVAPSMSSAPTDDRTCSPFTSIADIGTAIFEFWDLNEALITVDLPFPFLWRGQTKYTTITASPNGVIYLGDVESCGTCSYFEDCCEAFPIGKFANFGLPRIALGQTDLEFHPYNTISANAYFTIVGNSFVVSYEGADFYPASENMQNLYFQVVLYSDGNIEMRWGQGYPQEGENVVVGLEDDEIVIPATGELFDSRGVTTVGTWPANQCRTFVVTAEGNYTEYDTASVSPSISPAPSKSETPSFSGACAPYSSIGAFGTPVFEYEDADEELATVLLPFEFKWRGEKFDTEYSSVTVSPNGVIFLGDYTDCPKWCQYDKVSCCEAFPIGDLSGSRIPRIALAQQDLQGTAYYATVEDSFVISFEGTDFIPFAYHERPLNLFFQVALYRDGRVEIRWGQGLTRNHQNVAAGLEDFGLAVPVTGAPFGPRGVTEFGEAWPTNQCRMFIPTMDGNYTERF